jgi:hypothetical protein
MHFHFPFLLTTKQQETGSWKPWKKPRAQREQMELGKTFLGEKTRSEEERKSSNGDDDGDGFLRLLLLLLLQGFENARKY